MGSDSLGKNEVEEQDDWGVKQKVRLETGVWCAWPHILNKKKFK